MYETPTLNLAPWGKLLLDAMRIAASGEDRETLAATTTTLAVACIAAAMAHPEWAAAIALTADSRVRALSDAIVVSSRVERVTPCEQESATSTHFELSAGQEARVPTNDRVLTSRF